MGAERGSSLPRWQRWTGFWVWVLSAVVLVLLVAGVAYPVLHLVLLLLPCLLAVLCGGVELLAPRWFLRWRDADTAEAGWDREALEWFDDALGMSRRDDGDYDDASVRRTRIIGGIVLAFGAGMTVGVIALHRAGAWPPA